MVRSLRRVLLWLLMLALPLQGLAGVARLHCADGPGTDAAVASHAAHGAAGPAADHSHATAGHPHATADHDHGAAASATPDDGAAASCSACAACCVALALVPQWPQAGASAPRDLVPLPPQAPATTFLTSGPERPPRSAHA